MSANWIQTGIVLSTVLAACVMMAPAKAVAAAATDELKVAGLYLKLGKTDQCRAALEQVQKTEPDNVEALVLLSKLELRQGNQGAALKAADSALGLAPDNISATIVKARVLTAQGKGAEAQKMLALVQPDELERHEAELEGLIAAKDATASKDGAAADKKDKDDDALDAMLEEARHALASRHFAEAGSLALKVMRLAPENTDAVLLRADVLNESGHSDEAVKLLKKLKAADKSNGLFPDELALASALQDAGREEEARVSFEIVASGSTYSDEDRKQARSALAVMTLQKALTDGDKELDAGHGQKALDLAEVALKIDPANNEAKSLKGRSLAATGQPHEAVAILSLLKTSIPVGKRFDEQSDFASALMADHQYYEALAAYGEMEDHTDIYKKEEQTSAREQIIELRDNSLAGGDVELTAGSFEEGRLLRTDTHFSTARFGALRYTLDTDLELVKLDPKVFKVKKMDDRFSSSIGFNTAWNEHLNSDFHLGGFKSGVVAGAGVSYHPANRMTFALHANYNDPARDSLFLMAMDGRQHDLTANITLPIGKHWAIESVSQARQVELNGTNIGNGLGTETQFRWHPITNEDNIYLGYTIEYRDFNGNERAFDGEAHSYLGRRAASLRDVTDLIPELVNRHALQAHGEVKLTPALTADGSVEIAWRQESKLVEYGATAGLEWRATRKTTLTAKLEYYSGGSGPNSGAGVILAAVGAKWYW